MQTRLSLTSWTPIALLTLIATIASAHPGSGIAIDKDGQVFFTDTGRGISKIDANGKFTEFSGSRFHWLALDPNGRFANSDKTFGEWFERVTPKGSRPTVIQCSDFPLVIAPDGNIYYADTRDNSRGRIVRRTPEGRESVLASDAKFQIAGITAASDGSLYIADNGPDNSGPISVRKIAMDGTVTTMAAAFTGDPIRNPPAETPPAYCRGLAVDADGVIYIAATGSRRVLRITPAGEVSTILESPAPWQPTDVALFNGDAYILEWHEPAASRLEERDEWMPRVRKVAKDGTITTLVTVSR